MSSIRQTSSLLRRELHVDVTRAPNVSGEHLGCLSTDGDSRGLHVNNFEVLEVRFEGLLSQPQTRVERDHLILDAHLIDQGGN